MAGEARTNAFMLGTATVMLGALADLMNLDDSHSIGLVKNVIAKSTPGFTDLTQGVKNTLVASVMTQNDVEVTGEVYEYTSKNLSYMAGLDGSTVEPTATKTTVKTAVVAPVAPSKEGAKAIPLEAETGLAADDTIFIQIANTENVMVRKIVSIDSATKTITVDRGLPFALPVGTIVRKVNVIGLGSTADQPYLAAKIVGTMANGDLVTLLLPKVRISSGLNLGFQTENFDNMPLTLKIFDQVGTDPFYQMFQSVGPEKRPAKCMLLTAN